MTNADKTELENLIRNVASMKKTSENANAPYFDKKVSDFAKEAVRNHNETKETILTMVRKNLALFLDLDHMPFHRGVFTKYVDRGEVDSVVRGRMFYIYYRIHTSKDWNKIVKGSYGNAWYAIDPDEVEITDVTAQTSDTSLPEYRVCSTNSLTYWPNKDLMNFDADHSSEEWRIIYCRATWTRAQTELLVKEFKNALEAQAEKYRNAANSADADRELNTKVGVYVKVTL